MTARFAVACGLAGVFALQAGAATAQPADVDAPDSAPLASATRWSSDSASTLPRGRTEFGIFHPIHWGVTDRVELSASPLLAAIWPHLEVKARWYARGDFAIATRHRVSYVSALLDFFSREGALGLLPANSDVPFALGIDTSQLATWSASEAFRLTTEVGVFVVPKAKGGDRIVLDFPFLYSRFAAVDTGATVYLGANATGAIGRVAYAADLRFTPIAVRRQGAATWVLEAGASLQVYLTRRFGLNLGARVAHGRYPVGRRTHFLPVLDIRVQL